MSIKAFVKDAVAAIFPKIGSDKDAVVKELLVANTLATAADSRKKRAKAALLDAGLVLDEYRPGEVEAYRSDAFVLIAKTSEPGQRLDAETLLTNLLNAGLSRAKATTAIPNAMVDNKAATKFEIVER